MRAGLLQEAENILAPVPPIAAAANTIEFKSALITPTSYAANADLKKIGYLLGSHHPLAICLFSCLLHNSLPVLALQYYSNTTSFTIEYTE